MSRPFTQVDVFGAEPYAGNPVAVVLDAAGLSPDRMQRLARWTNLSETTFVLPPSDPKADYRVRIFTPATELPFAGHPTLGTCHAWLERGGVPRDAGQVVQECGVGLVPVRRDGPSLAFAAPDRVRSGPVDEQDIVRATAQLGIDRAAVVDAEWADNGVPWLAIMLGSVEEVLAVRPRAVDMDIGLVALHPPGASWAYEVRAFFPKDGATAEDPVTGSLHAALAQWMLASGHVRAPYAARQGTALGREGRVAVTADPGGQVWIGGATVTCVRGTLELPDR